MNDDQLMLRRYPPVSSHPSGMLSVVTLLLVLVGPRRRRRARLAAGRGSRAAADIARLEATLQATRDGEARLEQSLRALTLRGDAPRPRRRSPGAVAPLHDALLRYERRVADLERDRVDAYAELREQVRADARRSPASCAPRPASWWPRCARRRCAAGGASTSCAGSSRRPACSSTATSPSRSPPRPTTAASGPTWWSGCTAAGRWWSTPRRRSRPTCRPMEARDERDPRRPPRPARQAPARRTSTRSPPRRTGRRSSRTPDFVVLFVPADPFLDAALQRDPTLLEHAFARNVVLATPATLVAMLRTVAYAWRQESLARNALAVHGLARELYARLATLGDHVGKLGASLGGAVDRVQPGGRLAGVAGAGQRAQAGRDGGVRRAS